MLLLIIRKQEHYQSEDFHHAFYFIQSLRSIPVRQQQQQHQKLELFSRVKLRFLAHVHTSIQRY